MQDSLSPRHSVNYTAAWVQRLNSFKNPACYVCVSPHTLRDCNRACCLRNSCEMCSEMRSEQANMLVGETVFLLFYSFRLWNLQDVIGLTPDPRSVSAVRVGVKSLPAEFWQNKEPLKIEQNTQPLHLLPPLVLPLQLLPLRLPHVKFKCDCIGRVQTCLIYLAR